jgi:hypothetical protein
METATLRQSASFRLNSKLLAILKERAKASNRSLNNYVESVLLDAVYFEPNETTIAAIEEAKSGKELEKLDLDNFKSFVDSL